MYDFVDELLNNLEEPKELIEEEDLDSDQIIDYTAIEDENGDPLELNFD